MQIYFSPLEYHTNTVRLRHIGSLLLFTNNLNISKEQVIVVGIVFTRSYCTVYVSLKKPIFIDGRD